MNKENKIKDSAEKRNSTWGDVKNVKRKERKEMFEYETKKMRTVKADKRSPNEKDKIGFSKKH